MTIPYRMLGNTCLSVSVIGIGGRQIGGAIDYKGRPVNTEGFDRKSCLMLLSEAVEHGINFCETSDMYGRSEEIIGEFLRERYKTIIVSTKCGVSPHGGFDLSPLHIRKSIEGSLDRLNMENLDIYLGTVSDFKRIDLDSAMETFLKLKEEGKAGYIGFSVKSREDAEYLLSKGGIDVLEIEYNLFNVEFGLDVIPACRDMGVGVIIKSPLNKGVLTGKYGTDAVFDEYDIRSVYLTGDELSFRNKWIDDFCSEFSVERDRIREVALRFILSNPHVSTIALGMSSIKQLLENIETAKLPPINLEERISIEKYSYDNREGFEWRLPEIRR